MKEIEIDTIDDLESAIADFEMEGATVASPRDYAKMRGIAPQRVYYMMRNRKLTWHHCECGRKVVNIEEADEVFGFSEDDEDEDDQGND